MLVKTLDGMEYKWKMKSAADTKKSGPHLKVRELLHELYPTLQVLEEVQILVKKNKDLYLDFYIPLYKLAVEIDGQQHRSYNTFYHRSQSDFVKQKVNDNFKSQWCDLNQIRFIRLRDDEEREVWQMKMIK
jgi:hypothetical protein